MCAQSMPVRLHELVLTSCIGQRVVLADAVLTGRPAFEMVPSAAAFQEIIALAAEVERIVR